MTVNEFLDIFVDIFDDVTIYDLTSGEEVWTGDYYDMPEEYADAEISSVDYPSERFKGFTINLSLDED